MPDLRQYRLALSILMLSAFTLFGNEAEELLKKFGESVLKLKNVSSSFVQVRKIPFVRQEIRLEGVFRHEFSGRLLWKISSPIRCAFLADRDKCFYWDEETNKVVTLDIRNNPVMRALMESMKLTLSGTLSPEEYGFSAETAGKYSVRLIPRKESITAGFIKDLVLTFKPDLSAVAEVLIREQNGSETKTVFQNTTVNSTIPETEWQLK